MVVKMPDLTVLFTIECFFQNIAKRSLFTGRHKKGLPFPATPTTGGYYVLLMQNNNA